MALETMDLHEVRSAMEGILFAAGEPVNIDRICLALEVLTIIAYYQPTTRAYVNQVRGVDSSYTMGLLQERKLIEECGRLQVPGRPRLYRTTKEFLRVFHLSSLEELPEMPGLEADGQLRLDTDGAILDPTQLTAAAESEPDAEE